MAVNFHVLGIEWNPDGRSVLVKDSDKFCVAFPVDDVTASGMLSEAADEI
jgi:hypothetical protein